MIHVELESIAHPDARILDVGGKDGNKVAEIKGKTVTIDMNLEPSFKTVEYISCDGRRMPFSDDTFDIIHCQQVLEHVSGKEELIAQCARVLKPDGIAHFSFPNRLTPIKPHALPRFWSILPRNIGVPLAKRVLSEKLAMYYERHSYNLSPIGARRVLHPNFDQVEYISMELTSKFRDLQRGRDPERYQASAVGRLMGEAIPLIDAVRKITGIKQLIEVFYPGVMYRCRGPKPM